MARLGSRGSSAPAARELKVTVDARQRMLEFYRDRDRQDAERWAGGEQRGRGGIYAQAVARLEGDADVYESYTVLRAAGIELAPGTESFVQSQPRDWRFVCRIDSAGRVWTASLREKNQASW